MRSHSRKGEEQTGREHQSILRRRRRRIIFLLSYLVLSLLQCFFILYILYIFYTCFYYVLLYFYYTFIIFPIMFLLSLCSSLIFFLHFSSHFFHWQRTVTHNPWVRCLAGPSVSTTTVVSTQIQKGRIWAKSFLHRLQYDCAFVHFVLVTKVQKQPCVLAIQDSFG